MKKITKKPSVIVLIFIIALATVVPALAETIFTDNNGFSYTQLGGNYASVCDWEGDADTLDIPLMVNDSYVKEIGAWAFSNRDDFTTVSFYRADYLSLIGTMAFKGSAISGSLNLPSQLKTIGNSAFQECASLETLYYNTTADIPDQCFYQCNALEKVTITAGVTKIGRLALAGCESLSYVWIPKSVTEINATAFNGDHKLVIHCYTDSYAQQYALDNGIDYVLIDAPEPTEPPTEAPTDEPTEAPTDEPTSPEPIEVTFILGDADGDGQVTILDATKIQRVLVDLETDEDGMISLRGNVNNEDKLSIMHATKIQRWIADYETEEPIGTEVTVWI